MRTVALTGIYQGQRVGVWEAFTTGGERLTDSQSVRATGSVRYRGDKDEVFLGEEWDSNPPGNVN
jgi:hypothetical protein